MYNSCGGRWSLTSLGLCGLLLDTLLRAQSTLHALTHTTERAMDESTQPCVDMCVSRGGRGSPTSLGLRTLLLDQPQTQPIADTMCGLCISCGGRWSPTSLGLCGLL